MNNYVDDNGVNFILTNEQKKELIQLAIRSNVAALSFIDTTSTKNIEYIYLALELDPSAIVYVDNKSYKIYEFAARRYPESIKYFPKDLIFLKRLIEYCNNETFKNMDPCIFTTIEFDDDQMYEKIKKNKLYAIRFYRGKNHLIYKDVLYRDSKIIFHFSKFNWLVINELIDDLIDVFFDIIKTNQMFDEFYNNIKVLKEEYLLKFIKIDPDNFKSINTRQLSNKLIEYTLSLQSELIQFINFNSLIDPEHMILKILRYDGILIQYVIGKYDITKEMYLTAVRSNVYALNYISNPSFEIIHEAYTHDPDNFVCIRKRTQNIIKYAKDNNITMSDGSIEEDDNKLELLLDETKLKCLNDMNVV